MRDHFVRLMFASAAVLACGSDDPAGPDPSDATIASVTAVTPTPSGTPGWRLAEPVGVVVRDAAGRAMPGVTVAWESDAPDAWLSAATSTTDSTGTATVEFAPGKVPGTQRVIGTVGPLRGETRVAVSGMRFTAAATGLMREVPWSSGLAICGIDGDGRIFCGPYASANFSAVNRPVPPRQDATMRTLALEGSRRFVAIAGLGTEQGFIFWSHDQFCAVDTDGGVWCWTGGDIQPTGTIRARPIAVPEPMAQIALAEVGLSNYTRTPICALARSGVTYCLGPNGLGEAGIGSTQPVSEFTPIAGDLRLTEVRGGFAAFCGRDHDQRAWCWGSNTRRRFLAVTNDPDRLTVPTRLGGDHPFLAVAPIVDGACGISAAPTNPLQCWGNAFVTYRDGTRPADGTAAGVIGTEDVVQISGDDALWGVARRGDGRVLVWGLPGDGTNTSVPRPPNYLNEPIGPLVTTYGAIWCETGQLTRCVRREQQALTGIPMP